MQQEFSLVHYMYVTDFFLSNHVLYKLSSANYKYMYIIILDARFLHVYLKIHVCIHHLQSLAIVTTVLINYACILFKIGRAHV